VPAAASPIEPIRHDAPDAPVLPLWRRAIKPVVTVAVATLMVFGIQRLLGTFDADQVIAGFGAVPVAAIAIAIALLFVQQGLYVVEEVMAARFAGQRQLGVGQIAIASLVSRSLSTLGLGTVTGLALRLRIYGWWGLSGRDVATLTIYKESTYVIGLIATAAMVFTFADVPDLAATGQVLPAPHLIGIAASIAIAAYVIASLVRREPLQVRSFQVPIVRGRLLIAQLVLPVVQAGIGGAIVWVCLPDAAGLSLLETIVACFVASLAGSISQVPGGLGVFETVVLEFAPTAAHPGVLAGLLVRRVVVNLLPIAVGTVLLVGAELVRHPTRRTTVWSSTAASAVAVTVFAAGILLVISASVGVLRGPLAAIAPVEHGMVFALGFATLLVARGLHLRHVHAWRDAIILVALRLGIALLSGPELPAVVGTVALLGLLAASRHAFLDHTPPHEDPMAWWAAVAVGVLGIGFVALVADRDSMSRAVSFRVAGAIIAAAWLAGAGVQRARRRRRR
jgi:phosphatidylglycerol lysyltransferase